MKDKDKVLALFNYISEISKNLKNTKTNIAEEKLTNVIKELVPFIASNFIVLAIVTYVPAVTIGVVKLIMGN